MKKRILEWIECDDVLAYELMTEKNLPIRVVHEKYYPKGIPVDWINPNNHTCSATYKPQSATFFYNESVTFEFPVYEGQETAF